MKNNMISDRPVDMTNEGRIVKTMPLSPPKGWVEANSPPFLDQILGVLNMYCPKGNEMFKEMDTLPIGGCSCRRNDLVIDAKVVWLFF